MSLINRMLTELDARRADSGSGSLFGQQVRAVPARRRMHPAWWVVLILAAALAGSIAWNLFRPLAPQPYAVRADLPLRMEGRLSAVPDPESRPQQSASGSIDTSAVLRPDTPANDPAGMPAAAVDEAMAHTETAAIAEAVRPPVPALTQAPKQATTQSSIPTSALTPAPVPAPVATGARHARGTDVESASSVKSARAPGAAPAAAIAAPQAAPVQASSEMTETRASEQPITRQIRTLSPRQQAENAYRKAVLVLQQGHKSEALSVLEEALRLDPGHAAGRQTVIAILMDAGRTDEAVRHAREGAASDSSQIGLAMILARLLVEQGEPQTAIQALERSLPYAGTRTDFLSFYAALLQRAGRHGEAAERYTQVLQQEPQNGLWWMGLGISLQAEDRNAMARSAFQHARASNALSPELLAFVNQRISELDGRVK